MYPNVGAAGCTLTSGQPGAAWLGQEVCSGFAVAAPVSPLAAHCMNLLSWKCHRHVAKCWRRHNVSLQFWPDGFVSPTFFSILWQFVLARADIYQIFRNSYVETYYYGMGVHKHRRSILSRSPFCHVLHMKQKLPQHFSTQPRHTMYNSTIRPCLLQRLWVQ